MKFYMEPRFWITLSALVIVAALGLTSQIGGDAVLAFIGGILVRFGGGAVAEPVSRDGGGQ